MCCQAKPKEFKAFSPAKSIDSCPLSYCVRPFFSNIRQNRSSNAVTQCVCFFTDEPEDDQNDPDAHFDDFTAEDFNTREFEYDHDRLEWTEEDHAQLGEDGEGGYIREPSVDSEVQAEALPIEDGAGGYIIDPSMVSSSPIRSFKRLSDLDPQERAGFDNQFKSKRARGRRNQRGTQQMTGKERHSTTWGRDDFDDLFESGKAARADL